MKMSGNLFNHPRIYIYIYRNKPYKEKDPLTLLFAG